jgi:molecular chaperone DnaK
MLGGDDFDKAIVNWLAAEFMAQEGVDLLKERQALQRLTEAAEKAKIELSTVGATEINLPFITATLDGPLHLERTLKRSQFERLTADLLDRLYGPVEQVLKDAQWSPRQIDEVVLVGGASRIPAVQGIVEDLIGKKPNQSVNPDEVVAVGAAIQAAILAGEVRDVLLLDVTPLSLGVETYGGVMKKLIPRNTTIPTRRSDIFTTAEDNQTSVEIHVLQGERDMAEYNRSLGRFKLSGLSPQPRGMAQVEVMFDINADGILCVSATDRRTGIERRVTIKGASTLDEKEVERMLKEAEEFAEKDRARKERIEKLNRADRLISTAEQQLKEIALDFNVRLTYEQRKEIEQLIRNLKQAIDREDDYQLDIAQSELQEALYRLSQELYSKKNEEEEEDDDLFGGILEGIGSLTSRNRRSSRPGSRRPDTRVSYDEDDDDWI